MHSCRYEDIQKRVSPECSTERASTHVLRHDPNHVALMVVVDDNPIQVKHAWVIQGCKHVGFSPELGTVALHLPRLRNTIPYQLVFPPDIEGCRGLAEAHELQQQLQQLALQLTGLQQADVLYAAFINSTTSVTAFPSGATAQIGCRLPPHNSTIFNQNGHCRRDIRI